MRRKQNKESFAYYAKILFVISVAFLGYGTFLQFFHNSKLNNYNEVIIPANDGTVSVTPYDGIVSIDVDDNSQTDNRMKDDDSSSIIDIPSIDDANAILKNELQSIYHINILYGDETIGYAVMSEGSKIGTLPIVDSFIINKQLLALKNVLELYPAGIFQEISDGGIPLTIILIQQYDDKRITGITDSSNNYARISIASIYPFEESFFHESYHYIERYLLKKGAKFTSWESFNPAYFKWGVIYNNLAYSTTFSADAYFVNTYAQTSAAEDRASTFEYMMASSKASCLNTGTVVWSKADYMSRMIRYVLKSVQILNHRQVKWEQYLY